MTIKITPAMRRMVNDTEFFHIVKAVVEVQNMVRDYENKYRAATRQRYHESAVAVGAVLDGEWLGKAKPAKPKPVPLTVRPHLDD